MPSKKLFLAFLISAATLFFCIDNIVSNTNHINIGAGATGAPSDGNCTGCHSGTPLNNTNGSILISLNGGIANYTPNTVYNVTVTLNHTTSIKKGFRITALNSANLAAGTFTAGVGSSLKNITVAGNVRNYVGHNAGSTTGVWTFTWTSPASGTGQVKLYACGNASNSSGGTGGDQVYTTVLTINELISNPPSIVNIQPLPSDSICTNTTLLLNSNVLPGDTGIASYSWNYNDGSPLDTTASVSHVFTTAGNYNVQLITIDSLSLSDTSIIAITVLDAFNTSLFDTICSGQSFVFNGNTIFASGSFMDTLLSIGGCDSILTLNLLVLPPINDTVAQSICINQSFIFNGQTLTVPGFYLDTLVSAGGCDSIVTLNLSLQTQVFSNISQSICFGDTITFNGLQIFASGNYLDTISSTISCDTVVNLNLTVSPLIIDTFTNTICFGSSYIFNGITQTASGYYPDTLVANTGCDSIVILNLIVNPKISDTLSQTICSTGSILFNGVVINTAGQYLDTLVSTLGCDSFIVFNLNTVVAYFDTISGTICPSGSLLFNGVQLTTAGFYNDTLASTLGCDSFVTLQLNVAPINIDTFAINICNGSSYLFNGTPLTTQGTYTDTLTSGFGCDSIVTINLGILNPTFASIFDTICSSQTYLFGGLNLNTTGVYVDTITNIANCDSIITLNLVVNSCTAIGTIDTVIICNYQTYLFNNQTLNSTGIYLDTLLNYLGNDSIVTLDLTVLAPLVSSYNASVCNGQAYFFNGQFLIAGGIYADTLIGTQGCDSIVTLNLGIGNSTFDTIYQTINAGQTFLFNGILQGVTGLYNDTLINGTGCDSVLTLNLNVITGCPATYDTVTTSICNGQFYFFNNINIFVAGVYSDTVINYLGCDSIITLNLSLLSTSSTNLNTNICAGASILFNGNTLATSGIYFDTLINTLGCDSLVTLNLAVIPVAYDTFSVSICGSQTYLFAGATLSASGFYNDTLVSVAGCDSIVTLNLNSVTSYTTPLSQSICAGQTYLFNNISYTIGGFFLDTMVSVGGCDSFINLTLTVNPISTDTINQLICSTQTYNFNGVLINASGTYYDTLTNSLGCDSIITLQLVVINSSFDTINVTTCSNQPYLFNGQQLIISGAYNDTLVNAAFCDSIITLNLIVNAISTDTINQIVCNNQVFLFNGANLNTSGVYYDTLINANACDSFVVLNLLVLPAIGSTINASICAGQPYLFNGSNIVVPGTYFDTLVSYTFCDSIVTLNLLIGNPSSSVINIAICNNQTYNFNGTFLNTANTYFDTLVNYTNCDSFITLNLAVGNVSLATINQAICAGQVYNFNNTNLSSTGIYLDTLINTANCDSIVTLNLTVNPISLTNINSTICAGQTYLFNGNLLSINGIYNDTLINYLGCDSFVVLNLIVLPAIQTNLSNFICGNQTILFNGQSITNAGVYFDTLLASSGCDSLIILNVTAGATSTHALNAAICGGNAYFFNGIQLTTGGTYFDTLTNYLGCDSILALNLIITPSSSSSVQQSICAGNSLLFNNQLLTIGGFYNFILTNYLGCDSIITLNLNVLATSYATLNASICAGTNYNFNGSLVNQTGIYFDTLSNAVGCDSIISLHLIVDNAITIHNPTVAICQGQGYTHNGNTYYNSIILTDHFNSFKGCDSSVITQIIVTPIDTSITVFSDQLVANSSTGIIKWIDCNTGMIVGMGNTLSIPYAGSFAAIVDIGSCADTSSCFNFATGVSTILSNSNYLIYPNPITSLLNIDCLNLNVEISKFRIYNNLGQLVLESAFNCASKFIDLNGLTSGNYLFELIDNRQIVHYRMPIVKVKN